MPRTNHTFSFLFLIPGPFNSHGPFAKITRRADKKLTRQIAFRAVVFPCIATGLMIVYNALNKLIIVHH